MLAPWKKSYTNLDRQCINKQRHHFANKGVYSQSYGFSSSQQWIRWLGGITDSMDVSLSKLQVIVTNREDWRVAFIGLQS